MVYRVPIPLFLEWVDGLTSAPRFSLSNQTKDKGDVLFIGAGGRKRLQTLLDWVNDGTPPSGVYLKSFSVKSGEFTLEGLKTHVEALRGPDDEGYYHGRCPSCVEKRGGDTGRDHFYANITLNKIGCFAGCKKYEVLEFFKETKVSPKEIVQTSLPLSVSAQNSKLVSIPDDWKTACAFVYSHHYEAKRNQNQFYLGKAAQGWDTLGGKREGNETPEECMIREVQEELGVQNVDNIEYIGYDSFSKSVLYKVTTNDWPEINTDDSVKEVQFFGVNDAKNANLSFRGRQHLKMLIKDAQVVSTERSETTNDKLQTKAIILEQNVDFLVVQKLKKTGEAGTSHKIMIEELQTFASSFGSFKKGQRISIQEHYDALGWDLVKDQGTRAITRRYHPYIAALYALGEIVVYKDGSIERRV